MHIMDMDIGEGKEGLLKLSQQQQLIQRLILIFCIEDTMDTMDIPTDTMDMDIGEGKEGLLKLSQ